MDPFSAAAAAGTSFGDYASAQATNETNRDIAASNNAWSAAQYGSRYQTMTKDLQAAGLNPMLAYSQSPGSAPSAQAVQFQNPSNFSGAARAYSDVRTADSSATRDYSSAAKADTEIKQVNALTDKIKEETKNVPDQGVVLRQTAQKLTQETTLLAFKELTEIQQTRLLKQTISNLEKDGILKSLDVDVAEKFDNFGREYKQYQPIVDLMKSVLRK